MLMYARSMREGLLGMLRFAGYGAWLAIVLLAVDALFELPARSASSAWHLLVLTTLGGAAIGLVAPHVANAMNRMRRGIGLDA